MGEDPPSAHDAGGRTPAGDRAVVSGAQRKPGTPRAARAGAARTRSAPRAAVADRRREAVPPDTVGRSAPHIYAVGGKTPAPRCRVIPRAERKSGIPGTARAGPPGPRPTPGDRVGDPRKRGHQPTT